MNKFKSISIIGLAMFLFSYSNDVQADNRGEFTSSGVIEFVPSLDLTLPVDPLNPVNPIDPTNPVDPGGLDDGDDGSNGSGGLGESAGSGTAGPLSIDYASSLNFGRQLITSVDRTDFAAAQRYRLKKSATEQSDVLEGPNYIQVTDNRGTESGWTLKVNQHQQFISESGRELTGAEITFTNGEVVTTSQSEKPEYKNQFVLKPTGDEVDVMSACVGEGAGTYLLRMGHDTVTASRSIALDIPGETTKYSERYSTKFVWTLADIPGNQVY